MPALLFDNETSFVVLEASSILRPASYAHQSFVWHLVRMATFGKSREQFNLLLNDRFGPKSTRQFVLAQHHLNALQI